MSLATLLAERGHASVISPLLEIQRNERATKIEADAVVITSRYAVPQQHIGVPCYIVGEQTARALPEREVLHVFPDVHRLIETLPQVVEEGSRLLYLRGSYVKHDLKTQLPMFDWQEDIRYEAKLIEAFRDDAQQALSQGKVTDVLFFSRRTAVQCESLLQAQRFDQHRMTAWCLSQDIADALWLPCWKKKRVSREPTLSSLLTSLSAAD